jgi:threonine dehydratase
MSSNLPADPLVVPLSAILEARDLLSGVLEPTRMLESRAAARVVRRATGVNLADATLHLKAEHLQVTGSFKPRGATVRIRHLDPAAREAGVIAISAGNHAQAVAWAARAAGVRATAVMPLGAVRAKVDATRSYGAEVVLAGDTIGETWARMEQIRDERGLTFLHPFDDADVIAGQGTVGLEILRALPDLGVVVVPAGGGGLACGIAAAVKESAPGTRVYAVEPEGSTALSSALEAGRVVPVEPRSIADGLGAPFAGERTLAMGRRYLDGVVLVSDAEIASAMRFATEQMGQVLEPAGAAALAALLAGRVPLRRQDRACAVLSGGNVDRDRFDALVAAAAPFDTEGGAAGAGAPS